MFTITKGSPTLYPYESGPHVLSPNGGSDVVISKVGLMYNNPM